MKKVLALIMAAMALLLSACSNDYDRGYEEGYEEGYETGHDSGYESGLTHGYNDGKSDSRSDGYKDGYSEASSEYEDKMNDLKHQIRDDAGEVILFLLEPEDIADEYGTSYDDFMAYYSQLCEYIHENLLKYYRD